jgi:hypothetical protein
VAETAREVLGRLGERLALEHYERLGFRLLERNHRTAAGEPGGGEPARPYTPALRIDAVAVLIDERGTLVSLEQFENVA